MWDAVRLFCFLTFAAGCLVQGMYSDLRHGPLLRYISVSVDLDSSPNKSEKRVVSETVHSTGTSLQ